MQKGPIVYFGTDTFSAPILEALIDDGWKIGTVVTKPDSNSGRGRKLIEPEVKVIAKQHGIKVLQPNKLVDVMDEIKTVSAKISVLASYGKILSDEVINMFPNGIVNVHPSLLPKYRGPSPIVSTILNGDTKAGVSLIRLTKDMDAGPIYAQADIELLGTETGPQLFQKLMVLGSNLLISSLQQILNGNLEAKDQDNSKATYCKMITKKDSLIDWQQPAQIVERHIRAFLSWPGSRTVLGDKDVIITEAEIATANGEPGEVYTINKSRFGVYCGEGSLEILKLKPAGKAEMSASAYLAGYSINKK